MKNNRKRQLGNDRWNLQPTQPSITTELKPFTVWEHKPMNAIRRLLAIPAAIALSLGAADFTLAETVQLAPGFSPNPKVLTGTSGGGKSSNCGNIPANPSQTVTLTQAMDLVFSVQGANSLTLLIKSPDGGEFCVISDGSGNPLQQPGYWNAGTYQIYIGDRAATSHSYSMSITRN